MGENNQASQTVQKIGDRLQKDGYVPRKNDHYIDAFVSNDQLSFRDSRCFVRKVNGSVHVSLISYNPDSTLLHHWPGLGISVSYRTVNGQELYGRFDAEGNPIEVGAGDAETIKGILRF